VRQIGPSYRPAKLGIDSWGSIKDLQIRALPSQEDQHAIHAVQEKLLFIGQLTGRPLSKVLPCPNKGSRSCLLNVLQLRDIS
jgi:hypothetical protein